MKGTFAKLIQRSLVAMLLVFGALVCSTSRAEAQQVGNIHYNWVTSNEAIATLENAVNALVANQTNYPQGSPAWVVLANQIEYYKSIMVAIEGGAEVPVAVFTTLITGYNPNPGMDAAAITITPAEMDQLRATALDLLTN
jgi:hypothetical protein